MTSIQSFIIIITFFLLVHFLFYITKTPDLPTEWFNRILRTSTPFSALSIIQVGWLACVITLIYEIGPFNWKEKMRCWFDLLNSRFCISAKKRFQGFSSLHPSLSLAGLYSKVAPNELWQRAKGIFKRTIVRVKIGILELLRLDGVDLMNMES